MFNNLFIRFIPGKCTEAYRRSSSPTYVSRATSNIGVTKQAMYEDSIPYNLSAIILPNTIPRVKFVPFIIESRAKFPSCKKEASSICYCYLLSRAMNSRAAEQ